MVERVLTLMRSALVWLGFSEEKSIGGKWSIEIEVDCFGGAWMRWHRKNLVVLYLSHEACKGTFGRLKRQISRTFACTANRHGNGEGSSHLNPAAGRTKCPTLQRINYKALCKSLSENLTWENDNSHQIHVRLPRPRFNVGIWSPPRSQYFESNSSPWSCINSSRHFYRGDRSHKLRHAHIGPPEFWRLLAASDPRLNPHLWHFHLTVL